MAFLRDRQKGWTLAALGMLLVSTDAIFVRLSGTDALSLAYLVALFSLPVCLLLNRHYEKYGPLQALKAQPVVLLTLAALFALSQICFLLAIQHTLIANAVAIVAAGPVFVALAASVFLAERSSLRVWLSIIISLLGIALIVGPSFGSSYLLGDSFALLTILFFTASLLLLRRNPNLSRYLILSVSSLLVLVLCAPWVQLSNQPDSAWLSAAAMGLLFNTGGRIAYANAPRFAASSEVALFNPVETIAATVWGYLFFAEVPSLQTLLGALIVLAGLLYATLGLSTDKLAG